MAAAQSNSRNYIFLVASGFLCDSGDASTCPAAVKGPQGDSYELSGTGTFDAQNKSVKGAGTFAHKALNGNVLDSGVWIATELVSKGIGRHQPCKWIHAVGFEIVKVTSCLQRLR